MWDATPMPLPLDAYIDTWHGNEAVRWIAEGRVVVDGVQLAARVLEVANRLRQSEEVPVVRVDSIGIGASVVDQLRQTIGHNGTPSRSTKCNARAFAVARQ